MISDKRLRKELQECFDKYIGNCNSLEALKADGYAHCYNDAFEIVEKMAEENRIKASARRSVKKLLGR